MKYLLLLILFFGCGEGESDDSSNSSGTTPEQQSITDAYLSSSTSSLTVNVVYETGADPYVGGLNLSNDTWDITRDSFEGLLPNKTIEYPSQLSEMVSISSQMKSSWSASELVSVGNTHAPVLKVGDKANLTVVFVRGLLDNNSNILGVHVTGTRFVFVFKDVVESVGGTDDQQKYVEQATVVHELGHLIGLVDNGVPQATDHEDGEHPHHTSNDECVMFWAVENPNQILLLLNNIITSNQLDLFEDEVKNDVSTYSE